MRVKTLVIAGVAAISLFMVVAVVAGAAFMFVTVDSQAQPGEAVEIVPVVEPAMQSEVEVVAPVIEYDKASYTDGIGGCRYKNQVKNQMVEQTEETVSDDLLTQVAR